MRIARPFVFVIAFVLALLAGTEQAALAVSRWVAAKQVPGAGERPEQAWGSARGRGHDAAGNATDAAAEGGRSGALKAPGELKPDTGSSQVELGIEPAAPTDAAVKQVRAPAVPAPAGFDDKSSTEVTEKRAERARTFANPDGTFTTRFYNDPVNFRSRDGKWEMIDTQLAKPAGGARTMSVSGAGWEARSTEDAVHFAEYADAETVARLGVSDTASISYGLEGAAHSLGKVEGSVITYPEVRHSADLELIAGSDSIKETLILKDKSAPSTWRFPLALSGLTAKLDGKGGVAFTDPAGIQQGWMPPGWMEDSNLGERSNQGVISSGVTYTLESSGGRQVLVVSLDEKWLTAPDRVFPVKVDPSVAGVSATSGTYVQYPHDQNFSSDTVIKVGTSNEGKNKAAGFLRFDGLNSGQLKDAYVIAAKLSLLNTWSYSCTPSPVSVHEITSNWSESSATSWPGPATGHALGSKSFAHAWRPQGSTSWPCGSSAWEGIPLGAEGRQLVDDWTHGRKPNYGLAVKASESDNRGWKQFGSDDYPNGAPSLDVTWTKYGAAYQLGSFVQPMTATSEGTFKVTVTNHGQQTWAKDSNFKLRYDLYDGAGNMVGGDYWSKIRWTDMPHDVPPGGTVTLDAKIAPLAPATYTLAWTMDEFGVNSFASQGVPAVAMLVEAVNLPPYLTGASPPSGSLSDTLTPTLWAAASDKDRFPNPLTYQFEVCEVEGKDTRKNCRQSTPDASQSWAVPASWLTWSKTYAWYAYASDGQAQSARTQPSMMTTQVPQPAITSHLGSADGGRSFGERAGNFATSATDAAVSVVGPELAVTRTYNSQDPRQGNAFGTGWATRWDMRAKAEADGNVVITLAGGSQVRFGRNADATYSAPSGSTGVLTAEPGGGWTLRDASGALYTFDTSGLLKKIKDGHGREQLLTYTDGQLTKATDALSQRALTLTWSLGRVSTVSTDAIGPSAPALTWTYTYSNGRLTKVCPPTSTTACTVYEYTGGSQYRSMVLDASPVSYWRLNETEGATAASEAVSRTGLNAGRYRDVTLAGSGVLTGTANKAASFDGTKSHVEIPEATLASSKVLTVELWFKTTKPGVLVGFQDKRLGDGQPNWFNPVLAVDAAGKLRGGFEGTGGGNTPMSSPAAVTDDAWHHAVITSSGTSETLYLDGQAIGSRTGVVDHSSKTFAYLGAGFSSIGWDGNPAPGVRYFDGLMDEAAVYHRALDASTVKAHHDARTGTSKLTKAVLPSGRTDAQVSYDSDTERTTQVTDASGGTWKISAPSYSAGSQGYAGTVQAAGPVNYWRLGDSSGAAAADEISSGGNGSYHDGVTLGSVGAFLDGDNGSITLDGTRGAVDVPAETITGTNALAIELWFRTDKPSAVLTSLQDTDLGTTPTQWNPSLLIDADGKLRGHLWNGSASGAIISSNPVTDNEWHHVVLSGGTAGQTMYLDGVKTGFTAGAVAPESIAQAYLGAGFSGLQWDNQPTGVRYFSGQLDEAAFYGKELDAATVTDHYKARNRLISGNGAQYQGTVMADAPAGYWQLDETSGTRATNKIAVTGGNGTYTRTTLNTPGAFGVGDRTAAEFTGDGYAELPGARLTNTDLSVELWFKTTQPGVLLSDQELAIPDHASYTPVLYIGADNKLHGQYFTPGVTPTNTSPATVTDNQWHHAVLTAQGATQTLYLDGTQVAQTTNAPVSHQANQRTYIGAGYTHGWPSSPTSTLSYYTGQMDEVAVYPRPLTGEQVAKHYNARTRASGSSLTSTVTVSDPAGSQTSSTYDAVRGQRRTASTNADGGTTTFAYDTGGFLHTVTDPNGHATITGHDERGNTISTTTCRDSNSCWTSFAEYYHNADDPLDPRNGKPTVLRDARSASPTDNRFRTTTAYTPRGLTSTTTLADGRTSNSTYTTGSEPAVGGGTTPAGLAATKKSPGGSTVSYAYFANGDLAQATAPSGLVTTYTYDGLGRALTETQTSDSTPAGVTTTSTYNAMSRVVSETGPGVKNEITGITHTARVNRSYDADGLLLSESTEDTTGGDPTRTTTYRYDSHGLNESVTDPAGNETTFAHDPVGRVIRETDAAGNVLTHAYTKRGNLAESVLKNWTGDPSGQTRDLVLVSHAYDPAGRLASSTDAMGATTAYTYFDDGLQAAVTAKGVTQADGSKHDIVLESNEYDGAGNLTSQTASGGRTTTTHTVDATGRITRSVFDPNGLNRITTTAYDADNRVTESTQSIDASGKKLTVTSEYDTAGNPKKSTVTDGTASRTTSATFDQRGLPLTETSPRGNTGVNRYDELGRLVEQTAPQVLAEENGGTATTVTPKTLTGYNTFAEATETRDARGTVTRTETDKLGRPTATTLPDYTPPGGNKITAVTRATYDQLGRLSSTSDPLGRATYFAYDQLGNLTRKTDPALASAGITLQAPGTTTFNGTSTAMSGGGVHTYAWTPTGLPLSETDPTGARTEATYDELGRKLTATTVERKPTLQNLVSRYTWDDAGNQTASNTPGGRRTTATHNTAGEVLTVTDPAGGVTKSAYDSLGRPTESTDATGRKTTTAYDVLGKPTTVTDYGTGTTAVRTTSSEYDADGNMTATTSATGARRTYTFDNLGRTTKQVEPISSTDSITVTFGYDAAGNRTRLTDGRGKATYYTFTPWGMPESTIEPATSQHWTADVRTWTTLYDAAGQAVTEILPGNVKRHRTYDALGRLTNETGSGTTVATRPRTLTYDLAGRMTGSGGDGILSGNTHTYNDRGQLLSTDGPSGKSAYTYDADGSMTSRTDAAGTTAFTYDTAGRIDTTTDPLTGTQIRSDFDAAGRPIQQQYARPAANGASTIGANRNYTYDSLGRLTDDTVSRTAGGTVQGQAYDYDLTDQLVKKTTTGTTGATTNTYTYDLAGRMASWNDGTTNTPYEWDKAGNLTKRGSTTATYDSRNRLETSGTETYAYSARGTEKTVTDAAPGGTTRQIQSDAFERTVTNGTSTFTYDSLDRVMTHNGAAFTYDGGSNNLVTDGASTYSRTPGGTLLATSATGQSGTASLSVTDQHTDLVASLGPDGTTVAGSRAYDPFGKTTATSGTNPNVGYQSGWTDTTTGEINMAARWYQPGIGSFTSRDTWQLNPSPSVQANRYTYANASPLNATDPTGHKSDVLIDQRYAEQRTAYADQSRTYGRPNIQYTTGYVGWARRLPGWMKLGGYYKEMHITAPSAKTSPFTFGNGGCNHWMCGKGAPPTYTGTIAPQPPSRRCAARNCGIVAYVPPPSCRRNCGKAATPPPPSKCRRNCVKGTGTPPPPPIDQNPNDGKNPAPAPSRTLTPDLGAINSALWMLGDGWAQVVGSGDILGMIQSDAALVPNQITEILPIPANVFGGKNGGRDRNDGKCDDGPGVSENGHAVYLPRERYFDNFEDSYQCRATGVYGLLDLDDYNKGREYPGTNTNSSTKPPGMREIESKGHVAANGHLIPAAAKGSGIDLRNLVAEYEKTNTPYLNHGIERDIRKAVKGGTPIAISVTAHYDTEGTGIPTRIEYNYGIPGQYVKHCVVHQSPTGGTTTGSSSCPRR
ncbi:LamG-like jellyroll fold domain-containing protein [Streptomyces xanthophaeus]|uniref:LamG-like jellyroll fold domain-containing protein n=1 Tax=Streptomyces xanthophaeus TaxID=67385 RepID=UPI00370FED3E